MTASSFSQSMSQVKSIEAEKIGVSHVIITCFLIYYFIIHGVKGSSAFVKLGLFAYKS